MSDEFVGFVKGPEVVHATSNKSITELAHERLDEIISWVESGQGGGDFILTDLNTGRAFRITFCDFTGQMKCQHCGGTGVEGSNF